jgi:hypothetical protein
MRAAILRKWRGHTSKDQKPFPQCQTWLRTPIPLIVNMLMLLS